MKKNINKNFEPKILVILGPTTTGKSGLAVRLAKKFNGEIISADSRQVYKGLDIGSGKITEKEMLGIPHYCLDITNPKRRYSVSDFKKEAEKHIVNIIGKNKLPIICGGTGFYIQAVVDNLILPEVPPNQKLREKLEKKTPNELFEILRKIDSRRAKSIDKNNSRRLIRAIEIAQNLGKVPNIKTKPKYNPLFIGLDLKDKKLKENILNRLQERIKIGMIKEAISLHKNGLSWKRMDELGLEYRYLARFLKKFSDKSLPKLKANASNPYWSVFQDLLEKEIWHFAKRQRTWFKRDRRINWFKPSDLKEIEKIVIDFL